MPGDRMTVRRSALAGVLALIATTTLPTWGWPQVTEEAAPTLERKERIEPGWQIVDLPDLDNVKRRRFDEGSRNVEVGNELRRREVHYRQERLGSINFRL